MCYATNKTYKTYNKNKATPNEVIKQTYRSNVADKYASAVTKSLGLGSNFLLCSAGNFFIINLSFLNETHKTLRYASIRGKIKYATKNAGRHKWVGKIKA